MNFIQQLIKQINTELSAAMDCNYATYYGLTQLIEKDGKTNPIEIEGKEGCKIIPDDRKPMQIYHRLNSQSRESSPTEGVGDQIYERFTADLTLFCIGIKESFKPMCDDSNLMWLSKVDGALSRRPNIVISGIEGTRLRVSRNNSTQSQILESEFRGNDLKKLNPLMTIAFSIEYQLSGMICGVACI